MRAKEFISETASAGATSSGNIATVVNPNIAGGVKNAKPPKVMQKKHKNGTAVNALDMMGISLFGGETIKR
jgi:hypothetical protein